MTEEIVATAGSTVQVIKEQPTGGDPAWRIQAAVPAAPKPEDGDRMTVEAATGAVERVAPKVEWVDVVVTSDHAVVVAAFGELAAGARVER